jgi:hypothetical protein
MRVSDIFGGGNVNASPGSDWCKAQRDGTEAAGGDISEMDCSVDGVHYPDPRSPNAATWD